MEREGARELKRHDYRDRGGDMILEMKNTAAVAAYRRSNKTSKGASGCGYRFAAFVVVGAMSDDLSAGDRRGVELPEED